jgi:aspartate-semialdehyde dehydrogenase
MPITAHGKDDFLSTYSSWLNPAQYRKYVIVADNLRKGAATNAVQICEALAKNGLI